MRKILASVLAVGLFSGASVQDASAKFGIGAGVSLPLGTGFSDFWGMGFGGSGNIVIAKDKMDLVGSVSYYTHPSEDILGGLFAFGDMYVISFLGGVRLHPAPTGGALPYGKLAAGASVVGIAATTVNIPGFGSIPVPGSSEGGLGILLGAGVDLPAGSMLVNVEAGYQMTTVAINTGTGDSNLGQFIIGAGLLF